MSEIQASHYLQESNWKLRTELFREGPRQSKVAKLAKLVTEMGKGRIKLKKRAMLSGLHAHKEIVRE